MVYEIVERCESILQNVTGFIYESILEYVAAVFKVLLCGHWLAHFALCRVRALIRCRSGGDEDTEFMAVSLSSTIRCRCDDDSKFSLSPPRGTDSAPRRICVLHHCGLATSVLCPTPPPTPRAAPETESDLSSTATVDVRNDGCCRSDCFFMVGSAQDTLVCSASRPSSV